MIDNSLVIFERGQNIVGKRTGGRSAPTTVNSSVRTREYLTTAEIERLMAAARKSSRYGHRDATMILIGYRHGLRASELCDLQWSQVELATGRLHVRRAKNGSPSVHPMQGDEIRALRRLQRERGVSSHVFMTERDGPMTPKVLEAKKLHKLLAEHLARMQRGQLLLVCSSSVVVDDLNAPHPSSHQRP